MEKTPSVQFLRSISEMKYVNADNVLRYRAIMRFFYQQYQKLNYWLRPEHIYDGVTAWGFIEEYTLEQCQADLEQLEAWGNLSSRHDGGKALTVEEYLRKKYQYLISPYSIEIERLLESLEYVRGYGGSLEPTLFDTIADALFKISTKQEEYDNKEALELWRILYDSFQKLYQASADYIASLHTEKAETFMSTDEFLIYKDSLTFYLKDFVQALQRRSYKIEGYLRQINITSQMNFLNAVVEGEWSIPKLEDTITKEQYLEELKEKWESLYRWFYGEAGAMSEMMQLEHATKEAIVKIVRNALRIQERKRSAISRRKELDYLGQWFYRTEQLEEAHKLAAHVFGLFQTRHLQGEDMRASDSQEKFMWKEPPILRTLRSRSRKKNERQDTEEVDDHSLQKQKIREKLLAQHKQEFDFLLKMVDTGEIFASGMGQVSAATRLQILYWIGRCTLSKDLCFQTPEGILIHMESPVGKERAILECEDGILELQNYKFTFNIVNRAAWEDTLLWLNTGK